MQRWLWDIILFWLTSGVTSGLTLNFDIKMAVILKMPKYYMQLQFDIRYEKIVPNYARKSIFCGDDIIHDVTGWPQSRPSLFLYKWNMNIFRDNWKTNKGIIIKLGVHMYPWILASTQSPDCPFICLFVCLFVRNFFDTGHSFWYIFTKLDPSMCLCHVTMPIVFLGQRSNN